MKKLICYILIFCTIVLIGGYQIIFSLHQHYLKSEVKTFLQSNKLNISGTNFEFKIVNNEISDQRFSWEEINEEFRFDNALYDVIRIDRSSDKITIIALKDNDENQLEHQYNEIQKKVNTANTKKNESQFKFFSLYFKSLYKTYVNDIISISEYFIFNQKHLKELYSEITSPPPRC